jgi:hypothetical protein
MLERLKTALVDSFVGAIAIGLLLSQGLAEIVGPVINPITAWVQQRQHWGSFPPGAPGAVLAFQSVLPQLLRAVLILLIAYGLLYWLYFPKPEKQNQDATPEPEEDALDREPGGAAEE